MSTVNICLGISSASESCHTSKQFDVIKICTETTVSAGFNLRNTGLTCRNSARPICAFVLSAVGLSTIGLSTINIHADVTETKYGNFRIQRRTGSSQI